jgi:hypothetical protein
MKMMKKLMALMMVAVMSVAAAFAKPVTVEYYEGKTFETATSYIGKVSVKAYLIDMLKASLEDNQVTITSIYLCDVDKILSDEEVDESDKAFFEEILRGPYSRVWINHSWGAEEWFVTDTNEVYCVFYEWIENEEK